jgi:hypothetical protein
MDQRRNEAITWLRAQVAAARANGGMVQSSAIYDALKTEFPDTPMTMDDVCAALVQLTGGSGVAVEFAERATG